MFDSLQAAAPPREVPLSAAEVRSWIVRMLTLDDDASTDERLAQITVLEALKGAAAAAQAGLTVAVYDQQRGADQARGIAQADTARCVGARVALARRESPHRGSRHLGLAQALVEELPCTYGALRRGEISEWRAVIVAQETACTTRQIRATVDQDIAEDLARVSDRRARALAGGRTAELDAASVVAKRSRAVASRRVSVRPAPDGMAILTAVLPCADAISAYVALQRAAEERTHVPTENRSRGQQVADLLIERLTGREVGTGYDVRINLVMDTGSLLAGGNTPARLDGYGPITADLARELVTDADKTTLRRLFTTPHDTDLVRMETTARTYTGLLRELITLRDEVCRTPYCDAPIRHIDHIQPHAAGGPTSYNNGQGLCANCNYTKEHPDWQPAITTRPPLLPGQKPRRDTRLEQHFRKLIDIKILTDGPHLIQRN
ncbi:DUF222 domain-containing protein [Dermatophilaceae bacterium Sec6.4]